MAVLTALGNGLMFGLFLTILIGPVFFALIQTSIDKGFRSGAGMAVGIAISDTLYIIIASFSVAAIANSKSFQMWLGLLGGTIMVIFGCASLFKTVKEPSGDAEIRKADSLFSQILKGFLLNGINPFVLLFWIGVATMVTLEYRYTTDLQLVFFTAIICTVLTLDIVKAFTANKLRRLLSPRFLTWMNRIVGVVLILSSFRLFYFSIEAMGGF